MHPHPTLIIPASYFAIGLIIAIISLKRIIPRSHRAWDDTDTCAALFGITVGWPIFLFFCFASGFIRWLKEPFRAPRLPRFRFRTLPPA